MLEMATTSANTDKIRVLHVCETVKGGPATYFNALLTSQAVDQEIVGPAEDLKALTNPANVHTFIRSGRNIPSLFRFLRKSISVAKQSDFDLIFCHSTFSIAAMLALKVMRPSTPIIYCAHGWASTRETKTFTRSITTFIERYMAYIPNMNISVSKSELDHAKRNGFLGKHVMVENGVRGAVENFDATVEKKTDRINFLFVGRHDRQKGLDLLLTAFSEAREIRGDIYLRVVGEPVVDGNLQSKAHQDGVTYTGWANDHEIDQIYREADACIIPSRWEAFGLVVAEAYRNGCPVLASDRGALPDMVEVGETGYIFPLSVKDIVTQLISMNKEDLLSMRPNCTKLYSDRFTVERLTSQIEALYRDAL